MSEQIHGGRRVRPMLHSDLERVLGWRNHPEVRRYMYTQQEIALDEHRKWFERTLQDRKKHLLIYESCGESLGFVNIGELGCGHIADWGFYAAPDAPRGTGRQLGSAALQHAFGDLHLHKVCGQVLAVNERSLRFHESLGFRPEGVLRDQHFDGERYHDIVCFGLLRDEWHSGTEKN
jgi:UDP-4-amino-4,6-dideoxy-N-acetyl-beta-L-altrosamine N-acetyltransferase